MMKAMIIEDELPSVRRLERMLQKYEIEIVTKLTSVKSTLSWLEKNTQPDLIFMDIQLSDGLCFEVFKHINISSKIIFTTAFDHYSIKAFDYNSISYLLKPIAQEKLSEVLLKAQQIQQKEQDFEMFKKLAKTSSIQNFKSSFAVKIGKKIKIIQIDEIAYFYSFENATFLKTNDVSYVINYSLTTLTSVLNPDDFFRVNRTFIIPKKTIKEILGYPNSRFKLILYAHHETEIIVSRERVKDFKSWVE